MGNTAPYFEDLRTSASAAADPAATDDLVLCDGVNVSEHVKSHINVRPWDHAVSVTPSGL